MAEVQAAVEGAELPDDQIEFHGKKYKICDKVGIWPLMKFARAAESGIDTFDYRALSALHAFLENCIHPKDWGRFQEDMIEGREDDPGELLDMATKVVQMLTSRPTPQPSASSNGQPAPSDGSTGESSSPEATG